MPPKEKKKVTRAWPVIKAYVKAASRYPRLVASILIGSVALFGFAAFIGWIGQRIQMLSIMHTESRVMVDLSNQAFRYLLGHSHDFFVSNFAGSLTRRVNRYARSFEQVLDTFVFSFFSLGVFSTGAILVLYQRSPAIGLALLAWTVVFVTIQVLLARWRQGGPNRWR